MRRAEQSSAGRGSGCRRSGPRGMQALCVLATSGLGEACQLHADRRSRFCCYGLYSVRWKVRKLSFPAPKDMSWVRVGGPEQGVRSNQPATTKTQLELTVPTVWSWRAGKRCVSVGEHGNRASSDRCYSEPLRSGLPLYQGTCIVQS